MLTASNSHHLLILILNSLVLHLKKNEKLLPSTYWAPLRESRSTNTWGTYVFPMSARARTVPRKKNVGWWEQEARHTKPLPSRCPSLTRAQGGPHPHFWLSSPNSSSHWDSESSDRCTFFLQIFGELICGFWSRISPH